MLVGSIVVNMRHIFKKDTIQHMLDLPATKEHYSVMFTSITYFVNKMHTTIMAQDARANMIVGGSSSQRENRLISQFKRYNTTPETALYFSSAHIRYTP